MVGEPVSHPGLPFALLSSPEGGCGAEGHPGDTKTLVFYHHPARVWDSRSLREPDTHGRHGWDICQWFPCLL